MVLIWTKQIFLINLVKSYLFYTKQQIFRQVQIESFSRRQNKCGSKIEICLWEGRKQSEKEENAGNPFPMFSNGSFFRVTKSLDCVVKC